VELQRVLWGFNPWPCAGYWTTHMRRQQDLVVWDSTRILQSTPAWSWTTSLPRTCQASLSVASYILTIVVAVREGGTGRGSLHIDDGDVYVFCVLFLAFLR
jgi:hypothetical protein